MRKLNALCAAVALLAVWGHAYPAGIDLPGHGQLLSMWANWHHPENGFAIFHELNLFTPYLLTYVLGVPFAFLLGGKFAIKVLLSFIALGIPWALRRWLRAIGGEEALSLLGYVFAFGFSYVWGFISFSMSLIPGLLLLAEVSRRGRTPTSWDLIKISSLAILLFFTHAVSYGLIGGISLIIAVVLAPSWKARVLNTAALGVSGAIALIWFLVNRQGEAGEPPSGFPPGIERLTTLWSGHYTGVANYLPAAFTIVICVALWVAWRARVDEHIERFLPVCVTLVAFLFLPETFFGSWYIGTRCLVFVFLFGLGVMETSAQGIRRTVAMGVTAVVSLGMLLETHRRLWVFNRELEGIEAIIPAVPLHAHLQGAIVESHNASESYGGGMHNQIHAWVAGERLAFNENDYGVYYQLPVRRRRNTPYIQSFDYFLGRGPLARGVASSKAGGPVEQVVQSGDWFLYRRERTPLEIPNVGVVVRSGQDFGALRLDHGVSGEPMSVAGETGLKGIGTHAQSIIHFRLSRLGTFSGRVGVDDQGTHSAPITFRILDLRRRELFRSAPMTHGKTAERFEITSPESVDLLLETRVEPSFSHAFAHADWFDFAVN